MVIISKRTEQDKDNTVNWPLGPWSSLPPTGNEVHVFCLGNVFLDVHSFFFFKDLPRGCLRLK